MAVVHDPRRQAVRLAAAVIGLAVVWLTVGLFTRATAADLTVALLVVLAEVLAVAVLSGPWLAVLVALAAVVLVNWYLVPPYGTVEIASADNVVSLVVFAFVAVVAATLVELGGRARARARESSRRAELLGEVVATNEGDDAATALERLRVGLGMDQVQLLGSAGDGPERVLASAGSSLATSPSLDVPLTDGYRLVGRGPELFAPDPDFLVSLGSAAVRAFEGERLQEESLRADHLAAIDRSRTALLASVGHDLRTPLAGLRVSIETLLSPSADLSVADRTALLETIEDSAERLDELITNLLDMSRLQAGAVIAHPVSTDVVEVVDRALLSFPDPRISVRLPDVLPTVTADPALLERMVANLVSNAVRYSPPDSPVEVSANHDSQCVVLTVADHGPGIPAEQTARVFEPFQRVGAQADGGSGLGLAIVKGLAEAMGLDVELRPGAVDGLEARIRMPRWTSSAGPS
jgi:K+-sensing histidine kinase KdpD